MDKKEVPAWFTKMQDLENELSRRYDRLEKLYVYDRLVHEIVRLLPPVLEPQVLYVSEDDVDMYKITFNKWPIYDHLKHRFKLVDQLRYLPFWRVVKDVKKILGPEYKKIWRLKLVSTEKDVVWASVLSQVPGNFEIYQKTEPDKTHEVFVYHVKFAKEVPIYLILERGIKI